jgi:hypothetical protein
MTTQTSPSAATPAHRGNPCLVARLKWHRHSCLCAVAKPRTRPIEAVTSLPSESLKLCRKFLIANLELEFKLSPIRINELSILIGPPMDPSVGVTPQTTREFWQNFRIYSDSDSAWLLRRTQISVRCCIKNSANFQGMEISHWAKRLWLNRRSPLHPHHQQGFIVPLRLPVRERGDLVQDRIDDLLRTRAAARL